MAADYRAQEEASSVPFSWRFIATVLAPIVLFAGILQYQLLELRRDQNVAALDRTRLEEQLAETRALNDRNQERLASLTKSTQEAFNQVASALGSFQSSITKLEEMAKKPPPADHRPPDQPTPDDHENPTQGMEKDPASATNVGYAEVKVLYATDRASHPDDRTGALAFGTERAPTSYGVCSVSIPRDHRLGQLESRSTFRFLFKHDPVREVLLLGTQPLDLAGFLAAADARIAASYRSSALVFIHGYNVSFEDAARRTAQISYDLGFDGAPIFYSWPSRGTLAGYLADENMIERSQPDLVAFLETIASRTSAQNIYLLGHSMGTRGLTRAFASLAAAKPELARRFRGLILAAPDIDAEVFAQQIAPHLIGSGPLLTLYGSSQDEAIKASRAVHQAPRAGEGGAALLVLSGIESIDATAVDTGLLGHSYFGEVRSIISDLFYLIRDDRTADQRFALVAATGPGGKYWVMKP